MLNPDGAMSHFRFITALIRILAVYLFCRGFPAVVYGLCNLREILDADATFDPGLVSYKMVFIEPLLYLGLSVILFVGAPWVAKYCLGRDVQTTVQPPPALESVMVFVAGFWVAAYAFLEAVGILVAPLMELRKPEYQRNAALMDSSSLVQGFLALVVAAGGLWIMLHFQRVQRWLHRRSMPAPGANPPLGRGSPREGNGADSPRT